MVVCTLCHSELNKIYFVYFCLCTACTLWNGCVVNFLCSKFCSELCFEFFYFQFECVGYNRIQMEDPHSAASEFITPYVSATASSPTPFSRASQSVPIVPPQPLSNDATSI